MSVERIWFVERKKRKARKWERFIYRSAKGAADMEAKMGNIVESMPTGQGWEYRVAEYRRVDDTDKG